MVERYPVFTWRPEHSKCGLDHWVEDPDFDIDRHITHHRLKGDGGREADAQVPRRPGCPSHSPATARCGRPTS